MNVFQLVVAGAVTLSPTGFHRSDLGSAPRLDSQANDIF